MCRGRSAHQLQHWTSDHSRRERWPLRSLRGSQRILHRWFANKAGGQRWQRAGSGDSYWKRRTISEVICHFVSCRKNQDSLNSNLHLHVIKLQLRCIKQAFCPVLSLMVYCKQILKRCALLLPRIMWQALMQHHCLTPLNTTVLVLCSILRSRTEKCSACPKLFARQMQSNPILSVWTYQCISKSGRRLWAMLAVLTWATIGRLEQKRQFESSLLGTHPCSVTPSGVFAITSRNLGQSGCWCKCLWMRRTCPEFDCRRLATAEVYMLLETISRKIAQWKGKKRRNGLLPGTFELGSMSKFTGTEILKQASTGTCDIVWCVVLLKQCSWLPLQK